MPCLDPHANRFVGDRLSLRDSEIDPDVSVYRLKAGNVQIVGELIKSTRLMMTDEARESDPLLAGMIETASHLAEKTLKAWQVEDCDPDRDHYEDWLQARAEVLEEMLEPALEMMRTAVEVARVGGAYFIFRRALVEPSDRVLIAYDHARRESATSYLSFDENGLKVERRNGRELAALRRLVKRRHRHQVDDLLSVTIQTVHGTQRQFTVSGQNPEDAISLALENHVREELLQFAEPGNPMLWDILSISLRDGASSNGPAAVLRIGDEEFERVLALADRYLQTGDLAPEWRPAFEVFAPPF